MRSISWAEEARDSVELARSYEEQGLDGDVYDEVVQMCVDYSREEWARSVADLMRWVEE